MKLKRNLMILIVLLVSAVVVQAANKTWDGGGSNDRWLTAANWDADTLPASGDQVTLDEAGGLILIEANDVVACTKILGPRSSTGVTTFRMTGGTLTNPSYWNVGTISGGEGFVDIQGGTITVRDLFVGKAGGLANVYVSGGTVNITGTSPTTGLIMPGDATGTGNMYVSGGTVTCGSITMAAYGLIDVNTNGLVRVSGDKRTAMEAYVTSGYITANGGAATVVVLYDGSTYTTIQSSLNPALAKASGPSPATGFLNVSPAGVVLSWTAGVAAVSHNVYFGTDAGSLSLVSSEQAGTTYNAGNLNYTTTYYWRIDEVQSGSIIITGDTWQFKTKGSITIDYFETYADTNSLKLTWKDGSADSSSGSSIVLGTTSRETTGTHSCYLSYDNTGAVGGKYYSEIECNSPLADFRVIDAKALDIWYKGLAGNSVQQMYVALSDGTNTATVDINSVATQESSVWIIKHIDLAAFTTANPSLDLNNIAKIYIGVGSKDATSSGGTGTVYVDYISLWPSRCMTTYASDLNDDCKVDFADFAQLAADWLGNGMWPL